MMSLNLLDLQIELDGKALFDPLTISIRPGEIITVMGPSGCGKSTLLSAICGSVSRDFTISGDIRLRDKSVIQVPMEEREIGILFQDDLLFPHLDIAANLAFALKRDLRKTERRKIVRESLQKAGLDGFAHRDPATLSGGQRARVSLLRTLLANPKAILLDEPFSRLDQKLKDQIRSFVFEQIRQMNIPALLVTHDPKDCPGDTLINLETSEVEIC